MSTDEYVPDEMDARGCFLDGAAGAFVTEDWEAFLARVRRDAWAEGFQDGRRYDGEGDDGPRYTNPYSGQDADQ